MNPTRNLLHNPAWVNALFGSTEFAWLWLIARVYIGWEWVEAGWHKVTSDAWMGGGTALQGYWERAVAIPDTGRPAISYDWYRQFLEFLLHSGSYSWFAKLIALGEVAVGIALLLGLFTGISAFFGSFMNWNFMLAGSASTNPVMGLIGIALMVAWKTAGWWGLDRVVLPMVGAPWQRGPLFGGSTQEVAAGNATTSSGHLLEQWVRVLLGVAVALYALIQLSGAAQVLVLLAAGVFVAITGLNWVPIIRERN